MKRIFILIAYVFWASSAYAQSSPSPITCVSVTPTINTTAYTAGDCMHASAIEVANIARTNVSSGRVTSILVTDKAANAANLEMWLFTQEPSTICSAINAAFDPADADLLHVVGGGPLAVTAHFAASDNGVSVGQNFDAPFVVDSQGTSLYLAVVTREGATYAVGDLTVEICVKQD